MTTTIGLLHPGEMGSVVGAAARAGGARVLWVSGGRSGATRSRAKAAGLEDVRALSELVSQSDMILSICPPANALGIAREVASLGFGGTYVDGNAVSPATTRVIGDVVATAVRGTSTAASSAHRRANQGRRDSIFPAGAPARSRRCSAGATSKRFRSTVPSARPLR
jgi:3-hydroxyisobutyrate dehydrogenase-like beta-hydroxyacid dehydrogenase